MRPHNPRGRRRLRPSGLGPASPAGAQVTLQPGCRPSAPRHRRQPVLRLQQRLFPAPGYTTAGLLAAALLFTGSRALSATRALTQPAPTPRPTYYSSAYRGYYARPRRLAQPRPRSSHLLLGELRLPHLRRPTPTTLTAST